MKNLSKTALAIMLAVLFVIGAIYFGSKDSPANATATARHTEQEVKDIQKSPDPLINAYLEDYRPILQSPTPNKESLGKLYSLSHIALFTCINKTEEVYTSQLSYNAKETFEKVGKLFDYTIEKPVTIDDARVNVTVNQQFEKTDVSHTFALLLKDDLWYIWDGN